MGWEQRGNNAYYYHSVRHGPRVRKQYFGADVCGLLAADAQSDRTTHRQARRDRESVLETKLAAVDGQLDQLESLVNSLAAAVLYSQGLYRHGREWRLRKRWPKPTPSTR
jgi:hypothetical protein